MARTVLVTGSSRGLGLEFVRILAGKGDRVIATARAPEQAPELARLAWKSLRLRVDEESSIAALARDLAGAPIDVLIHNAGVIGEDRTVDQVTFAEFERVFRTNAFAPAVLTRALLPNLRAGKGRMVLNISSELGSIAQATPGFSYAYNASKAALNMITARLAKDLAHDAFTVVSFCPGWNKTDMGGPNAPLEGRDSIAKLLATAERLTPADSGKYLRIDGSVIPW
jgi:NAD(P)-dependent dehydrogenase (short-subunit alcohol dehydrogenase family)